MSETVSDWLPFWIVATRWIVLPLGTFVAVRAFARVAEASLVRGPVPKEAPPWPENAHALQRVGSTPLVGVLLAGGALWILVADRSGGGSWPPRGLLALVVLAGFAAFVCERKRLVARHGGLRLTWSEVLRTRLAFAMLGMWLLYVPGALVVLERRADPHPLARFALGTALLLFLWFGGALRLARAFGLARLAGERLRTCVARVAARAGMPPPRAYEVDMAFPNACALSGGGLVVTSAALACFDEPALEAVVAHELGHLRDRWRLLWMTVPFLALALFVSWSVTLAPDLGTWWWLALPAGVLAFLFVLPRLGRAAELRADAFAHAHADPAHLASALETMHRACLTPPRLGPRAPHPDLAERQRAAGVTPSEASTAPHARGRPAWGVGLLSLAVTLAALFGRDALLVPEAGPWRARTLLALRGPEPFSLSRLAEHELAAERPRAAHALFRAGALLEPANPWWTMQETVALLAAGDCAAARERLAESERLSAPFPPEDSAEWYAWARAALANCR